MFTVQTCVRTKKCFIITSSLLKSKKLLQILLPWKILQNLLSKFFHIVLFYKKKSNSTIEEKTTGFPNSKNLKLFGQSKNISQNLLFLRSVHVLSWYMCTKVYMPHNVIVNV